MGKIIKNITQLNSPTPDELYQRIAAESVARLLVQVKQGNELPSNSENNLVELDIKQHALNDFYELAELIEVEQGDPQRTIKEIQINPNQAEELTCELLSEGTHLKNFVLDQYEQSLKSFKQSEDQYDAYKTASGITRPICKDRKSIVALLTILFWLLESSANALLLLASNTVAGGYLGSLAIAGLVSAINTFSGYLCGEYFWRHLTKINHSKIRWLAWLGFVLISLSVILVNFLFAYFRAFGEVELIAFLHANNQAYLHFFSIFLLGLLVFIWITIKWNKTNDPIIQYDLLYEDMLGKKAVSDNAYQEALNEIAAWKEHSCEKLDTLLRADQEDFVIADEALDKCNQIDKTLSLLARKKNDLYCAVIAHYRNIIVSGNFDKIPEYFYEKPTFDIKSSINLDGLTQSVATLKINLEQLTFQVQELKKKILTEANVAYQSIYHVKEKYYATT
jgi:hypothetical protein